MGLIKTPKVALCHPNFSWGKEGGICWNSIPHALCILASVARDICEIRIIDAHKDQMTVEEFAACLKEGEFDLVAISIPMDLYAAAGHIAVNAAKEILPKAIVLVGGVYPTVNPEEVMKNPAVDYACMGEGENLFPEIIGYLFQGGKMPSAGLAYRQDNTCVIQEKAPFVENLDSLPMPAYDLVPFAEYASWFSKQNASRPFLFPFAEIMTSRGCPHRCCFCQSPYLTGRRLRCKSPEKVLDEIAFFKNNYNIRSLLFVDDHLAAIRERAVAIFEGMIERGLAMPWKSLNMAVFSLDEELLKLMAKSGCRFMAISIESGSERILKDVIGKPQINIPRAMELVKFARELGIFISANFVIGFPDESWDEIRQTIRVAETLKANYVNIHIAMPLRHTRLWEMCEQHHSFVAGFDPVQITDLHAAILSPNFDPRELIFLRAYEWDRINFPTQEQRNSVAEIMAISTEELEDIRRNTRKRALTQIEELESQLGNR